MSIRIKKAWIPLSTPLTVILKHTTVRAQKAGLLPSLKREETVVYSALLYLPLLKAARYFSI